MAIEDMVKRHSNFDDTKDFIPTPPWATRVLYEEVAPSLKANAPSLSIWDPACGAGHMTKVFEEYGHPKTIGTDAYPRPMVHNPTTHYESDFIESPPFEEADVIVTNPPYRHLNAFIDRSLSVARFGTGMLVRVQALETEGRYKSIYRDTPPTQIAFFANRISFKTGEVVRKAPKMYFHVWLWWERAAIRGTGIAPPRPPIWVPFDAQTTYEKDEDYA